VAPSLLRVRNRRNYVFVILLAVLFVANLLFHLEVLDSAWGAMPRRASWAAPAPPASPVAPRPPESAPAAQRKAS